MSRFLLTRPAADSDALATVLAERGHEAVIAPLLTIEPMAAAAVDLDGVQALLFTSANGVRAFAGRSGRRDLPVFAVGGATAEAAAGAGFGRVEAARGTAEDLARLVTERLAPADGILFHGSGAHLAADLAALLAGPGFAVRRAVLYEARAAGRLPDAAARALGDGRLDGVLHFSPRTAKLFVRLVHQAGLDRHLERIDAFCLSAAVARNLAVERWRRLFVAERPERDALLALLDDGDRGQPCRDHSAGGPSETNRNH